MASADSSPFPPLRAPDASEENARRRSTTGRIRIALSGAFAAVLGVAPHVLHHAGPLAGAALLAGVGGSLLFGALGLILAVPFLLRLRRRFGSWRAPAVALLLFALVFSVSTFAVGPAITGNGDESAPPTSPDEESAPARDPSHEVHH
jgi:hypothetical protein